MAETNYLTERVKDFFCSCTESIKTVSNTESYFFAGYAFTAGGYFDLAAAGTKDFYFSGNSETGKSIIFYPLQFQATDGPLEINYYVNPTLTNPAYSALVSFNRKQSTQPAIASTSTIQFVDSGITDLGLNFLNDFVPAASATGPQTTAIAAEGGGGLPLLVDIDEVYILRITNTGTGTAKVGYSFTWEEPPIEF